MKITITDITRNGIWFTFPPLLFSFALMNHLPAELTPAVFNKGVPDVILVGENIARIFVFAMPAFFSIGLSSKTQKSGLVLYLLGVVLYYMSYGALIVFPQSTWSTSMVGFTAAAYINIFWMVGLGLLGDKLYFPRRLRYRSVFFIAPVTVFLILHVTHAIIVYQRHL